MEAVKIQKTGPDSVLVCAKPGELAGNIESHARNALAQAGIETVGTPEWDSFCGAGEMLLFCRAGKQSAFYTFRCAEDLIDAARALRGKAPGRLYAGDRTYYLEVKGNAPQALSEYAFALGKAPDEALTELCEDAFERLGR